MKAFFKSIIESNKFLFSLAKFIFHYKSRKITEGRTTLNILRAFPAYEAHGRGFYKTRAKLTMQSVNQVVPALALFASKSEENQNFKDFLLKAIASKDTFEDTKLAELFRIYGSDKNITYSKIYNCLLKELSKPKKILEIGLGTNNADIVSNMNGDGKPGASLRAFRDFIPNSRIYGADFDSRILFTEERIETYFVDQTNLDTFSQLSMDVGDNFDLMIDDGLHSPNANLHSLNFFLQNIKVGGFAVVEDISISTKPIWDVFANLIEHSYLSAFIETGNSSMFIVQRKL